MNEKRKSEGELIEYIFADDRSKAQKLLDKCKENEDARKLMIVSFGKRTQYLVPVGTDIERWRKNKSIQNKRYRITI